MSQLGLGVMIQMLGGNSDSAKAWSDAVGKKIKAVALEDDALVFRFADGTGVKLSDEGQSCCESRYMRTDDDLSHFAGAKLLGAGVKDASESSEDEYGRVHDIQFLVVTTDRGVFTCSSHNEHNGYYGGFSIKASALS